MPKLWDETIDAHRHAVREAALDATAQVVAERGPRAVTMSQIAAATGIGRATLYKYFSDVEAVLLAWHERQVTRHLDYLTGISGRPGDAHERLEAVLAGYARILHGSRGHHEAEGAAFLHRGEGLVRAEERLREMIRDLVGEAAQAGAVRGDVSADELAVYCLHALAAAPSLRSKAAVERLVAITLAGLARDAATPRAAT